MLLKPPTVDLIPEIIFILVTMKHNGQYMLVRLCIIFIFICCNGLVLAQSMAAGPRITALGSNGAALQDVWSLQSNQAGIAALKRPTASVSYQREYLNPDLNSKAAVLVYPFRHNVLGIGLHSFGFSAYNEQKASFSYAKNFGEKLFASITYNYHQIKISQYGNAKAYSIETGFQYFVSESLLIGAHIANPTRSSYSNQVNASIPVIIELGASYAFSDKLLLNAGVEKIYHSVSDFKAGIEYKPIMWLAFRGGLSANQLKEYAGFGLLYKNFHLDTAIASHPQLGFSPQLAISYEF